MTEREPNDRLRAARLARGMTQQQLAEAVAARIYAETGAVVVLGGAYVSRLERGVTRWPMEPYRQTLRLVLQADDDALGFVAPLPRALAAVAVTQPASSHGEPASGDREPDVSPAHLHALRVELGRQLAELRNAAGMTQERLARRLCYSRPSVGLAESGARNRPRQFWQRADVELGAGGVLVKAFDEVDHLLSQWRRQREEARRLARLRGTPDAPHYGYGVVVGVWGWAEARALREALRLTVREFAAQMYVSTATVTAWEHPGRRIRPHLSAEELLDRVLKMADDEARARFWQIREHYRQATR